MKARCVQFILQKFSGDEKVVVELNGKQYEIKYIKENDSPKIVLVIED
jgi:hypothetical protein